MKITKIYRTYRFRDKDKIIDSLRTIVQDERLKYGQVGALSGVSPGTLKNWFEGETMRPSNITVTAVSSALGYIRHDRLNKDGTVAVGFEKAREYDWKDEIERAATWMLKNDPATQRARARARAARKKTNGKGQGE